MGRLSLALGSALSLALAGCLFSGGPDDLGVVCERRSGSPSHPYSPDDVKSMTLIEPGLSAGAVRDAMTTVADGILTMAGSPYERFEGHLHGAAADALVFDANGTKGNVTDRYHIPLPQRGLASASAPDAVVAAPESLMAIATRVVDADPEASALVSGTQATGATWRASMPSCVQLRFAEHDVDVNVVQQRVVHAR